MHALVFMLVWVLVAIVVVWAGFWFSRNKSEQPDRSFKSPLPGGYKVAIALAAALLVLGIPAAVLSQTSDRMPAGSGTYTINSTEADRDGRVIFRSTCASCHSLNAANARGVYGPDLDESLGAPGSDPKATAARVESAIKTGGATGKQMPKELLQGEDAKLVSEYIARVAGR